MLKQIIKNKVFLFVVTSVLIIVGAILFISDKKETDKSTQENVKNEQEEKEPYDGNGLDIVEDDKETGEDSIDASGTWDDSSVGSNQTNNNIQSDKSESETNTDEEHNQNDELTNDKKDDDDSIGEDTLVDDKEWSEIY